MVFSSEHPYVEKLIEGTEYETDARNYISECQKMTEIERTSTTKEKIHGRGQPLRRPADCDGEN